MLLPETSLLYETEFNTIVQTDNPSLESTPSLVEPTSSSQRDRSSTAGLILPETSLLYETEFSSIVQTIPSLESTPSFITPTSSTQRHSSTAHVFLPETSLLYETEFNTIVQTVYPSLESTPSLVEPTLSSQRDSSSTADLILPETSLLYETEFSTIVQTVPLIESTPSFNEPTSSTQRDSRSTADFLLPETSLLHETEFNTIVQTVYPSLEITSSFIGPTSSTQRDRSSTAGLILPETSLLYETEFSTIVQTVFPSLESTQSFIEPTSSTQRDGSSTAKLLLPETEFSTISAYPSLESTPNFIESTLSSLKEFTSTADLLLPETSFLYETDFRTSVKTIHPSSKSTPSFIEITSSIQRDDSSTGLSSLAETSFLYETEVSTIKQTVYPSLESTPSLTKIAYSSSFQTTSFSTGIIEPTYTASESFSTHSSFSTPGLILSETTTMHEFISHTQSVYLSTLQRTSVMSKPSLSNSSMLLQTFSEISMTPGASIYQSVLPTYLLSTFPTPSEFISVPLTLSTYEILTTEIIDYSFITTEARLTKTTAFTTLFAKTPTPIETLYLPISTPSLILDTSSISLSIQTSQSITISKSTDILTTVISSNTLLTSDPILESTFQYLPPVSLTFSPGPPLPTMTMSTVDSRIVTSKITVIESMVLPTGMITSKVLRTPNLIVSKSTASYETVFVTTPGASQTPVSESFKTQSTAEISQMFTTEVISTIKTPELVQTFLPNPSFSRSKDTAITTPGSFGSMTSLIQSSILGTTYISAEITPTSAIMLTYSFNPPVLRTLGISSENLLIPGTSILPSLSMSSLKVPVGTSDQSVETTTFATFLSQTATIAVSSIAHPALSIAIPSVSLLPPFSSVGGTTYSLKTSAVTSHALTASTSKFLTTYSPDAPFFHVKNI